MNGGGGRAPALPAPRAAAPPRPRLPGGSGSRTRGPASTSRTGCSARLSRLGLGGLGPERPPRGQAESRAPDPRAPPSTRLARAQGTATDAAPAPSPPDAPLRPDVGGCGGRAAARGRRRGGKRFLPFPRAQGSFCGRFSLRSQTKFAAAFPRAAPPRVKRSDWRPAGAQPVGQEPRGERQSRDPGRGGGRQIPPSWGTSPAAPYSQPTAPEVAAAPSGAVSEKALAHRGRGAETEHPCQNRQGHVPLQRCTTRGFLKAERRPRVLPGSPARVHASPKCSPVGTQRTMAGGSGPPRLERWPDCAPDPVQSIPLPASGPPSLNH
nr:proline-rich protein 2-like isoform X2 [Globicephala melas]